MFINDRLPLNSGPNMTLLFDVFNLNNEVIYQTWDRTSAEMIKMNRPDVKCYTYTSRLPSSSIVFIANEQSSRDYHRYLQNQLVQSVTKMDKNVNPLIFKNGRYNR
jgi:predicted GTPase